MSAWVSDCCTNPESVWLANIGDTVVWHLLQWSAKRAGFWKTWNWYDMNIWTVIRFGTCYGRGTPTDSMWILFSLNPWIDYPSLQIRSSCRSTWRHPVVLQQNRMFPELHEILETYSPDLFANYEPVALLYLDVRRENAPVISHQQRECPGYHACCLTAVFVSCNGCCSSHFCCSNC